MVKYSSTDKDNTIIPFFQNKTMKKWELEMEYRV